MKDNMENKMEDTQRMKGLAIMAAKKAGDFLLRNFMKDGSIAKERGVAKEITTEYDKESDSILIDEISKACPEHNIVTEESGEMDRHGEYTWIIDSLDGTSNYANGNPFFSVSIALMKNDKLILGVVYAPVLKELYVAEKGKGAWLNEKRIHVSDISDLGKSYILGCEGGEKNNRRYSGVMRKIHPSVKDFRKLGSAALEGCYVASARSESYITLNISSWDVAAAVIIVEEAGGMVTDFMGNPWKPEETDLVMSNGNVHDEILEAVREV